MSISAIIPYYGEQGVSQNPPMNRVGYLTKTVCSLLPYMRPIIFVNNDKDFHLLTDILHGCEIVMVDCEPSLIPSFAMVRAKSIVQDDFVYYTEADQVIHFSDLSNMLSILQKEPDICIIPHRFSEPYNKFSIFHKHVRVGDQDITQSSEMTTWKDKVYRVGNLQPLEDRPSFDRDFYICSNLISAYGAAFLCSNSLFKRVRITSDPGQEVILERPVFEICGQARLCIKSVKYTDFFVDHLSDYDNHRAAFQELLNSQGNSPDEPTKDFHGDSSEE